jgi:hypothetical protein
MSLEIDDEIDDTSELSVTDGSGNVLSNNLSSIVYSIVNDTTGLFDADGGFSLNSATGIISGTPKIGKSGSFSVKASGISGTN